MTMRRSEDEIGTPADSGLSHEQHSPASGNLIFPCSASQNRCWFINSLSPGNPALNVALRWEVTGRLGPATAEQAFQTIVDRHEILRSRFLEKDGEAMQEALEHVSFRLSVIDLSMLPETERLKEALAQGEREAHKSFDLSQAPLIRVTFLRLSGDHAILLVTVHQIAFDGWSIRVLANEFGVIAEGLNAKRPYDLPQPPLQYGDYCLWQKEYFASGVFESETAYWKNKLGGAPYFEVVPDHERPSRPTYRGEILAAVLPPQLGEQLEEAARRHNLTLFSFGCAVTGAMLHRYTGENDVIFGTQIAGRDDPDLENMIGMFINNLVIRFDASDDPTFDEFLTRVNQTVQEALINQRMPFDKLVEILNPPRDPKRTPLISVNFTVLRDVMDHKSYGDFVLHGQPSLSAGSLYDLIFFMVHWPSGWRMAMEYNPDLFERRTAERLLDFLLATFEFAILRPDAKLSALTPPVRDLIEAPKPRSHLDAIELALRQHMDVMDAAVTPGLDYGERSRPYAYVTPVPGLRIPLETLPAKLSAYLSDALPGGSTAPSGVSVLLALPRNGRGDVDYRALPPPPAGSFAATPAATGSAARLDSIEMKLASIWRELLKVREIGPNSNFFELGGHSLLTIRLMARVAADFGVKLDPVTLFQAPTLREFAARLPISEGAQESPRLVQIQPEGDKTPIIAINNSVLYYNLARRIGLDRPFIGIPLLEPAGGVPAPVRTLNEIAVDYVRVIREAQPRGPYILCGLCVAGALAYECAQQLRKAGESVPLLILSDIWAPGFLAAYPLHRKLVYHFNYRLRTLRHRIDLLRTGKLSLAEVLSTFTLVRKSRVLDFAAWIGLIDGAQLAKKVRGRDNWLFLLSLEAARNAYKITPTASNVVILQSDEIVTDFADPNMGWTDLVKGGLFIRRIPGWHEDMFQDEGARLIAEYLQPRLEEVDAERDHSAASFKSN
ncbi:condensation domain-containing protein [Methylocella tundrae]|uniref:condensation domain-containing protein n=1 Tax=Methylocella tundrae TaxID=227605 RepID=UPI0030FE8D2A|nr:condensation domain-containing protein [Methylocella tundrae]